MAPYYNSFGDIIVAFTKPATFHPSFVGSIIEIKKRKGNEVITHILQRVIARCECEFQYINLDDELDPVAKEYTPNTPMVYIIPNLL